MISIKRASWIEDEIAIKSVRISVFVKEQQIPFEVDFDTQDATAKHWLAVDANNQPVGTARMLSDGHFGRMAVLKNYRNHGIGRLIMAAVSDYAAVSGMREVYLYAQLTAMPFYQSLGFTPYGKVFLEAGLEHIAMLKQLSV